MPSPRLLRSRQGMTLIEVLVVLALMSIMMVATARSLGDGGRTQAVAGSVSVMAGALGTARNEALASGKKVRLVVDSVFDANHPDNYMHRLVLMQLASDGTTWRQVTRPVTLLPGVFYSADYSIPTGQMSATFSASGDQYYFEFDETGQLSPTSSGANSGRMVVTSGHLQNGAIVMPASARANRDGVLIHRLGRVAYYRDPSEISLSTP